MGAVVFDLDGLLIDSEPFWRQAAMEVFATVGIHLTEAETRQTMGLRIDDAVRHWWERRPWDGMALPEMERVITSRVAELIKDNGEPMPGVRAVINLCRRRTIPMAVCSGSYAVVIRAALDRLGIAEAMSAWHSAEWEPLGKPHPGAYLTTADKLGVDPTSCLAFEDSFHGAISAKSARMRVVAVPEPTALLSPRWGFCDLVLDSLTAFDEVALRSLEGEPASSCRPAPSSEREPRTLCTGVGNAPA